MAGSIKEASISVLDMSYSELQAKRDDRLSTLKSVVET